MDLRGQDKERGMPSSLGYNPPIRESSSKVSSHPVISTGLGLVGGERRRDETGNGKAILNPVSNSNPRSSSTTSSPPSPSTTRAWKKSRPIFRSSSGHNCS
uniref:Uncharacterized protein n=1 Tax=Nelumbo nucifera TaxID=4432 RepID=A0A822YUL9_NELNU|nr:TPA_asm: hypothetical protein HUJ06_005425 [Nelumbo nucifera]